eukprot:2677293-Rhodomonas_salina.2
MRLLQQPLAERCQRALIQSRQWTTTLLRGATLAITLGLFMSSFSQSDFESLLHAAGARNSKNMKVLLSAILSTVQVLQMALSIADGGSGTQREDGGLGMEPALCQQVVCETDRALCMALCGCARGGAGAQMGGR